MLTRNTDIVVTIAGLSFIYTSKFSLISPLVIFTMISRYHLSNSGGGFNRSEPNEPTVGSSVATVDW